MGFVSGKRSRGASEEIGVAECDGGFFSYFC